MERIRGLPICITALSETWLEKYGCAVNPGSVEGVDEPGSLGGYIAEVASSACINSPK